MEIYNYNAKKMLQLLDRLKRNITPREKTEIKIEILRLFDNDLFELGFGYIITDEKLSEMVKRVLKGENPQDVYRELVSGNFVK